MADQGNRLARWLVVTALAVCFVLLQRGLWLTTSSLPHGWELSAKIAHQRKENAKLKRENAQRWQEVKALKHGNAAIEEHARMDLGLVKKGETFYQIVKAPSRGTTQAGMAATVPATAPAPSSGG